jgi:hypothetical protein
MCRCEDLLQILLIDHPYDGAPATSTVYTWHVFKKFGDIENNTILKIAGVSIYINRI